MTNPFEDEPASTLYWSTTRVNTHCGPQFWSFRRVGTSRVRKVLALCASTGSMRTGPICALSV